jgi:hypothetical protein
MLSAAVSQADAGTTVAVVTALIAATASLIAAVIAAISTRGARKAVERQRSQDHRLRQLSELYGRLYMLRGTSRWLWQQLPGEANPTPGVTKWRLIDHIEEIKKEPDDRRRGIVEQILAINEQLTQLINGKAGLLEEIPPPPTFSTFLNHARTLTNLWNRGVNASEGVEYVPFPGDLDKDVLDAITRLRAG